MTDFEKFKHSILIECLKRIYTIVHKTGIKIWIDSGTLLGIYREGKLIDSDDDIDLCISRHDFITFEQEILNSKELIMQKRIYSKNGDVYIIHKIGLYGIIDFCLIDLFIMDGFLGIEDYHNNKIKNQNKVGKKINKIININRNYYLDLINLDLKRKIKVFELIQSFTNCKCKDVLEKMPYIGYGLMEIYPKKDFFIKTEIVYPLIPYIFENIVIYMPNNSFVYLKTMYGDKFMIPNSSGFTHFKSSKYRESFI